MSKHEERIVRIYALGFDRNELTLPKGAEILSVSQLHERPQLFAVTDVLLTQIETRIVHLVETGRAFQKTENSRFIGSIFALKKWFHAFEDLSGG
jgi:hypothetical protein